jgi:cysteinyl-tRNA synthetase
MHNGRINMQGTKMSKSLGNIVWADDLLDEVGYGPFRILILTTHYRQPLEYSDPILKQAMTDYERIYRTYFQLFRKVELANGSKREVKDKELLEIRSKFQDALKNDFNTPNAITEIFTLVKVVNTALRDKTTNLEFLEMALSLFDELLDVLGLNIEMKKLTIEEKELVNKWQDARNKKDFEKADKLRAEMNERGIIV